MKIVNYVSFRTSEGFKIVELVTFDWLSRTRAGFETWEMSLLWS